MGYDLHITRKDDWSDEDPEKEISLSEWLAYIDADKDLVLSDAYWIKVPGSDTESQVAPGYCEWTGHPSKELQWFDFFKGCISTKNPDQDVIRKMLTIAEALQAKVQGDDGEIYTLSTDNQISSAYDDDLSLRPGRQANKPWWKFW
jgi:hypothetical protein